MRRAFGLALLAAPAACGTVLGVNDVSYRTNADAGLDLDGAGSDAAPRSDGALADIGESGSLSAYAATVLDDHPVLYFRFDETKDASNAHDLVGRVVATYPITSGGYTLGVAGAIANDPDTAVRLEALPHGSPGIAVGASADFAGDAQATFSVELWVKPEAQGWVLDHNSYDPIRNGWDLVITDSSLHPEFERWQTDTPKFDNVVAPAAPPSLTMASWHHLVGICDGTQPQVLWVDGTPYPGTNGSVTLDPKPGWTVGAQNGYPGSNDFTGSVDELAVYDHILPAARIQAHYDLGRGR